MNIENILSFIYVYRFNSFHKAANALYVTQPSLSSRIRTLERDLDTQLIIRGRNRIELTEDGKAFMPYALQIVNALTQAQNALQQEGTQIVIGTNVSISVAILPHVLRIFRQRHPKTTVHIASGLPEELLTALMDGRYTFILTQKMPVITDHPGAESIPVYKDPISLVVLPNHPFLVRELSPTFREAAMEPIIENTLMVEQWEAIKQHFRFQGVEPNVVLSMDSLEAIKHMILNGMGISFMPELTIEAELLNRQLYVVRPEPKLNLYRDIVLCHRKNDPPPYLKDFVDLISRYGAVEPT